MNIKKVKVSQLKPGKNPRTNFSKEDLRELAETYKTDGIIVPIQCDEKLRIILGERRWRAAKMA
jgi:ParB/RepB/Spo0J family partition protein